MKCCKRPCWTPSSSRRRGTNASLKAVLAAAAALAVSAGCTRQPEAARGIVHLTVWSMWSGQEEKNFLRVLARYHELHPNVVVENLGAVNDDTKTVRAIVAGVPPDLFTLSDPLYLGPLAANNAVYPLDEWFMRSGLKEADFVPASLGLCRYKGRLYAMPYLIDDYALFWNRRAFREAGLDPNRPPSTLEQLADYAVRLTQRDASGNLLRLGLQPIGDLNVITQDFGGRLYDAAANRITCDDAGNLAALKWYVDLINRMGGYQKVNGFAAGFGQAQSANNPFFVGKVAMMINGEWNPYWVSRYAPGLDYDVAPIPPPAGQPERARSTWLGGNMICIPRGSKHPKEAWDLLVWMQTKEAQILFAGAMNNVPNIRAALKSPELREGAPYKRKFAVFLDLADSPNGGHFPALPVANLYSNELNTAREMALDGRKTPEQALKDVRARVQKELNRYR